MIRHDPHFGFADVTQPAQGAFGLFQHTRGEYVAFGEQQLRPQHRLVRVDVHAVREAVQALVFAGLRRIEDVADVDEDGADARMGLFEFGGRRQCRCDLDGAGGAAEYQEGRTSGYRRLCTWHARMTGRARAINRAASVNVCLLRGFPPVAIDCDGNRRLTCEPMEDDRLVERLLARDEAALREFFDEYFGRLYRFAFARLRGDAATGGRRGASRARARLARPRGFSRRGQPVFLAGADLPQRDRRPRGKVGAHRGSHDEPRCGRGDARSRICGCGRGCRRQKYRWRAVNE